MFADASRENRESAYLYAVKINDIIVPISAYPYWKKDFLESSASGYAHYIQNGNRVMLDDYFSSRKYMPAVVSRRLLPPQDAAGKWLLWLASFTGKNPGSNASLKLYRYEYDFSSGAAVLKDSTLVYSQKTKSY
jgi:hypothetical protein